MRTGPLRPVTGGRRAAVVWLEAGVVCEGDNRLPPARGGGGTMSCTACQVVGAARPPFRGVLEPAGAGFTENGMHFTVSAGRRFLSWAGPRLEVGRSGGHLS